jgi:hypothetical protein
MRRAIAMIAIATMLAVPVATDAKACRSAHGRFVRCPSLHMPMVRHTACRDTHGHFKKC